MDIDWIVAIMVFLIFTGWAFSYYFTLFPESEVFLESVADIDRDKIVDFLSTSVYTVPVKLNSSGKNNSVLNASAVWYYGARNSTKVFRDGFSLPCRIVGDNLYWLANLSSGENYFHIEFSEIETPLNCDSGFSLENVTKTIPWMLERRELVSLSKINNMTNTSYEDFKKSLGIEEELSISLEWDGVSESYGKSLPENRDVYARTYEGVLWEDSKSVNVTIRVW